ncbi:hypothetical protein [Paradevosia shaoguanensis]|uniref:hypothetical protein n=1 Tax=Paradevosia shaoguanensis TaxID=1335043 RepID=UPI000455C56C|nr:hypothetical protein [Paradevosia shaoguanensis]CDP50505.1 hypothetical protein [Devosia sp. DBB001]
MISRLLAAVSAGFLALLTVPAVAGNSVGSINPLDDQAIFVFGGRYYEETFFTGMQPWAVTYENNFVLGGGYQQFWLNHPTGLRIGGEAGAALRMGDSFSGEAWAGIVARFDGLVLGDTVRIAPSVTFGLTAETAPVGIEAGNRGGGDSTLLFYIGPELNVSWVDHPETEVFWRIHHRSGAWGTLGNMADGANASSFGVRWKF